ncbi:Hypothetical predicted protein [Cloeon dipterum]|uniref:Gustatory receptor n=1 Tax=Cloeon dipterum TaxID=197152 RepID=A0A8S1CQV3_9INSE|nr:Hypothetical predicted protein [Cloeon dipterum]
MDAVEMLISYFNVLLLIQVNLLIVAFAHISASILRRLNTKINKVSESRKRSVCNEINVLRDSFTDVCGVVETASVVFQPLTAILVPYLVFNLLVDLYYFLMVVFNLDPFYKESEAAMTCICVTLIAVLVVNVFYVSLQCQKIEQTKNLLYHLEMEVENCEELKDSLTAFYFESLHYQKTAFNIFATFRLDRSLLLVFASVVTYLATIIQFHQAMRTIDSMP